LPEIGVPVPESTTSGHIFGIGKALKLASSIAHNVKDLQRNEGTLIEPER